jgi:hypothetical protein
VGFEFGVENLSSDTHCAKQFEFKNKKIEKLNRRCFIIEVSPTFYDIIEIIELKNPFDGLLFMRITDLTNVQSYSEIYTFTTIVNK